MRRGGMGMGRGRRMGRRTRRRTRRRVRRHRRRRRRRILLVGGLIAFGAYKLSKRDVERVEEHTGKDAEDLSDAELEQAMDDLNIEKQKRDASDQEYIDQQSGQDAGQGQEDYIDDLERLGKLKDEGIITEQEFEDKKRQLLGM